MGLETYANPILVASCGSFPRLPGWRHKGRRFCSCSCCSSSSSLLQSYFSTKFPRRGLHWQWLLFANKPEHFLGEKDSHFAKQQCGMHIEFHSHKHLCCEWGSNLDQSLQSPVISIMILSPPFPSPSAWKMSGCMERVSELWWESVALGCKKYIYPGIAVMNPFIIHLQLPCCYHCFLLSLPFSPFLYK